MNSSKHHPRSTAPRAVMVELADEPRSHRGSLITIALIVTAVVGALFLALGSSTANQKTPRATSNWLTNADCTGNRENWRCEHAGQICTSIAGILDCDIPTPDGEMMTVHCDINSCHHRSPIAP